MKRSKKIFGIVYIITILIYIFISYRNNYYKNLLYSQTVASRWSEGGRYSQITCLLDTESNLTVSSIDEQYKSSIDQALAQIDEKYREWIYCYSSLVRGTVSNDSISTDVEIIGVGGDFFQFHPLTILSGSYITNDDLMKDRIIITENVAWKLFGSNDIVGQTIKISSKEFIIAGVVQLEDDKYSKTACNKVEKVFVPFDEIEKMSGVGSSITYNIGNNTAPGSSMKEQSTVQTPITCLEIVMANPISNFAYSTISETFKFDKDMITVIQNSKRYSDSSLISLAKEFKSRSMILNRIRYPYWENAARAVENQLVILLFLRIILSCFIIISLIIFMIKNFIRLKNSDRLKELNLKDRLHNLVNIKNLRLIFRRRKSYQKDIRETRKKRKRKM